MMLACGVTVLCLPSPRPCHPHQPPCSRLYPELGLHALRAPCGQESGLDCGQGQGEGVEGNDSIVENQSLQSFKVSLVPSGAAGVGCGEVGVGCLAVDSPPHHSAAHTTGSQLSGASPVWLRTSQRVPAPPCWSQTSHRQTSTEYLTLSALSL